MQINYSPTNLDVVEDGNIIFENLAVGKWEYNVMVKFMFQISLSHNSFPLLWAAKLSFMLSFKNPFKEPAKVSVHI